MHCVHQTQLYDEQCQPRAERHVRQRQRDGEREVRVRQHILVDLWVSAKRGAISTVRGQGEPETQARQAQADRRGSAGQRGSAARPYVDQSPLVQAPRASTLLTMMTSAERKIHSAMYLVAGDSVCRQGCEP